MSPLRSLGNIISAFNDFYGRTGEDASKPSPVPTGIDASGAQNPLHSLSLETITSHIHSILLDHSK